VSPFNAVDNSLPLNVRSECQVVFITKSLRFCALSIFHSELLNVGTYHPCWLTEDPLVQEGIGRFSVWIVLSLHEH